MKTLKNWFVAVVAFVADGITRIFGLTDDQYPATGIQPYSGDLGGHGHHHGATHG
jgi:hypothetical protein